MLYKETTFKGKILSSIEERGQHMVIDFLLSSAIAITISLAISSSIIVFVCWYYSIRYTYYLGFEFLCQQTPGKMETQSKVIGTEKERPSIQAILLRNVVRFVAALSWISDANYAIHDLASNTRVVKDTKSIQFSFQKLAVLAWTISLLLVQLFFMDESPLEELFLGAIPTISILLLYLVGLFALVWYRLKKERAD